MKILHVYFFQQKAKSSIPFIILFYFLFKILKIEEARLKRFLKPVKAFVLKLKRGKWEEISTKRY